MLGLFSVAVPSHFTYRDYPAMSMSLCIPAAELRKALADIESAEKNGFMHCLAVFDMASAGPMLDACRARYSDLIERAADNDPSLSWGRFQGVTRKNRFENGTLVPLKE